MRTSRASRCAPGTIAASASALLLLIPLALPACAEMLQRREEPKPPVRNALRFSNGIALVSVKAPNDQSAWFALDTGAGKFTLIDPAFGKALALKFDIVHDPAIPFISLSAPIKYLEIEGFGRRDLTVFVNELAERTAFAGLDVKVAGVLGTGFFRGQCLRFDWAKGEFTPNEPRKRLARHVAIPLRYGSSEELYCSVKVEGLPCEALIDTASPQTLLTKEFAEQAKVEFDRSGPVVHADTALGAAAMSDGVVRCLTLGTEEVKEVPVGVVDRRMPHANLLIGTDVLSKFGVLIDLSDAPYLILDPGEGAARPEAPAAPTPAEPGPAAPTKDEKPKADAPVKEGEPAGKGR